MRTVIVDNYDSFTFNLYQMVAELTPSDPLVIRNDELDWEELKSHDIGCVIISPGPGRPDRDSDFGLSSKIILELPVPILGVCLGHQGIYHLFGGSVEHAPEPMHGRITAIHHDGSELFVGVPNPFRAVRYHSLICSDPVPTALQRTAWTADGLTMAVAHRSRPIWGVQFHPESICTEHGRLILTNFLRMAMRYCPDRPSEGFVCQEPATAHAPSATKPIVLKGSTSLELFFRRVPNTWDPANVFQALFGSEDIALWLDSAMPDVSLQRFSIMTGGSRLATELITYDASTSLLSIHRNGTSETRHADLFEYLKTRISEHRVPPAPLPFTFNCGFIGYLGYEMKGACGAKLAHHSSVPDCTFLYVDRCVVVDHLNNELYFMYLGDKDNQASATVWFDSMARRLAAPLQIATAVEWQPPVFAARKGRDQYLKSIVHSLNYIRDGESYEVCLTNQLTARTDADPLRYYHRLRRVNPAPYAAFLKFPELAVACSSPERFLRVTPDATVETNPIKGTSRRGHTQDEDRALKELLRTDIKSRSENLMIVDLLRNDLGRVCQVGTVTVPSLMHVETYATVHQLVSTISGELRVDKTSLDCLRSAFPGGSMTGAPKLRTMDIIDQLEGEARGVYSGCIGYLALNGSADFNIVIRTAIFAAGRVSIGVGGAIVAMSDPAEEWEEVVLKAEALLRAFGEYSLA